MDTGTGDMERAIPKGFSVEYEWHRLCIVGLMEKEGLNRKVNDFAVDLDSKGFPP